jgi:hypothetical protein
MMAFRKITHGRARERHRRSTFAKEKVAIMMASAMETSFDTENRRQGKKAGDARGGGPAESKPGRQCVEWELSVHGN